jgi:hypothetical protein
MVSRQFREGLGRHITETIGLGWKQGALTLIQIDAMLLS